MIHPQDARDGVLLNSLALWLSQSDPHGDWEELSLEEALSSALALLQENL
jgi:hypothetical protein